MILMRPMCVVIHLGNLSSSTDPENEYRLLVSSAEELEKLAQLMGIHRDEIAMALMM